MNFAPLLAQPISPATMQAVRYFQDLAPADALPRRKDFRPSRLRAVIGFVFMVDVLPGDYRWCLIGENVKALFGTDGTGELLSDLRPLPVRDRIMGTYDAVVASRTFHYCRGRYSWDDRSVEIERLLVPMADAEGRLSSIIGFSVPLEIGTDSVDIFAGIGAAKLEIDFELRG